MFRWARCGMLGDDIINLEEGDLMLRIFIALAIVALAAAGAWAVGARAAIA